MDSASKCWYFFLIIMFYLFDKLWLVEGIKRVCYENFFCEELYVPRMKSSDYERSGSLEPLRPVQLAEFK